VKALNLSKTIFKFIGIKLCKLNDISRERNKEDILKSCLIELYGNDEYSVEQNISGDTPKVAHFHHFVQSNPQFM